MGRKILGTIAGLLMAVLVVASGEALGHRLWPLPPGTDVTDPAQLARLMHVMPLPALASVVVAWVLGALAGGAVAARVGRSIVSALVVGALLVVFGVMTMVAIPHPAWMWACGILLPVPAAWVGGRFAFPRQTAAS